MNWLVIIQKTKKGNTIDMNRNSSSIKFKFIQYVYRDTRFKLLNLHNYRSFRKPWKLVYITLVTHIFKYSRNLVIIFEEENAFYLSSFSKPNLQIPIVEHGVILSHENIPQDPASTTAAVSRQRTYASMQRLEQSSIASRVMAFRVCARTKTYHRGPRGGPTSKAVNPLMH